MFLQCAVLKKFRYIIKRIKIIILFEMEIAISFDRLKEKKVNLSVQSLVYDREILNDKGSSWWGLQIKLVESVDTYTCPIVHTSCRSRRLSIRIRGPWRDMYWCYESVALYIKKKVHRKIRSPNVETTFIVRRTLPNCGCNDCILSFQNFQYHLMKRQFVGVDTYFLILLRGNKRISPVTRLRPVYICHSKILR